MEIELAKFMDLLPKECEPPQVNKADDGDIWLTYVNEDKKLEIMLMHNEPMVSWLAKMPMIRVSSAFDIKEGIPLRLENYIRKIAKPKSNIDVTWKYYRNGEIVCISETEARSIFDGWRIFSDEKGAATYMIDQLWNEIDRLREVIKSNDRN